MEIINFKTPLCTFQLFYAFKSRNLICIGSSIDFRPNNKTLFIALCRLIPTAYRASQRGSSHFHKIERAQRTSCSPEPLTTPNQQMFCLSKRATNANEF